MAEVQPIRNPKQIKAVCSSLKDIHDKYYIMFVIGIQTGLRISDILNLKVKDIDEYTSKKIKEKKTNKKRYLHLNEKTEKEIRKYIDKYELDSDDYLIFSRKHNEDGTQRPVDRVQAYRVLADAGEGCGLNNIGTHTMRKTFGYHYYKKTHDVATLMYIFNHASQKITLKYIGILEEEINESLEDFVLF